MTHDTRRQRRTERERLHAIAVAANAAHDPDEILLMIRNAFMEVGRFDRVGVWFMDSGELHGAWGTDESGHLRDEHGITYHLEHLNPEFRQVWNSDLPYAIAEYDKVRVPGIGLQPLPELRIFCIIALRARGELIGVVFADNLLSGAPLTEEDIQALLPFADQVAVAVANARLLAERQRLVERQRRLMEMSAAINASLELDEVLRLLRDAVVEAAGFDRAGVFKVEGETVYGAWGTDAQGCVRDERHLVEDLAHWSPFTADLVSGERRFYIDEWPSIDLSDSQQRRTMQHAVVGLRAGGELVGLLSVDNMFSGRVIDEESLLPLLPFAEQAAFAIRNARLLAERQRHLERQRRLTRIAAAINARAPLLDILRQVRDAVVEVGGVDRTGIFVLELDPDRMRGTWGTDREGNPEHISQQIYDLDDPRIALMMQVVRGELDYSLLDDYTTFCGLKPGHVMYGVHAHAIVPLRAGRDLVGVLNIDNLMRDAPITRDDIERVQPFAEQAAVAIQNTRLFDELRHTQEALVRSEKLRAIGELASGVAHNINNVLTAVLGYAELIQEEAEALPIVIQYARIIERAAMDGAEITRRMKQFARQETDTGKALFDLVVTVRDTVDLTRPVWQNQAMARGALIEVVCDLAPNLPVLGVDSEIREVMINLIKNAAEAMPNSGAITIRAYAQEANAIVEVSDTGIGMDEQTRRRIFEPFFTTKGVGLGSGLGLSVAWGIIERHGGRIEVQSRPGAGTCFYVRLPLAPIDTPSSVTVQNRQMLTGLRILLVEDEEIVASGLLRMLTLRGATSAWAANAQEALDWLADNAAQCDLVLSDHGMAGQTGMELLAQVRERYPQIRRVLLSGWGANLPRGLDTTAAEQILSKPVRLNELTATLNGLRTP
jgi:signal transduction histidine kinase/CheY-like chemotaxis protein